MGWIIENWEVLLGAIVALATAVTRLTPTPKDDALLSRATDLLGRLSVLEHKDSGRSLKPPLTSTARSPKHPDD